jgi:hypothetical protein
MGKRLYSPAINEARGDLLAGRLIKRSTLFVMKNESKKMNDQAKYKLSRWLIFISALTAISGQIYSEVIIEKYPNFDLLNSYTFLVDSIGLTLCGVFLSGLYLGSRGLGVPLSAKLFFHLIFTYPTRIILVPYLFLALLSIIYYELFW